MCRSSDAETARLLHAAAHDLKGPAGRLRVLSQLLSRSPAAADADTRALLAHIETSADEVRLAADGLARFAEVLGHELRRERTDLNLVLAEAVERAGASGSRVRPSHLPVVQADHHLAARLFEELLANALQFSGDAAEVRVSAVLGGPAGWFISVADDGPAIEQGLEERAFLPFKKLGAAGGAGVGLAIAREIAERHGGRLWAEPSDRGADLRFFFDGPAQWETA